MLSSSNSGSRMCSRHVAVEEPLPYLGKMRVLGTTQKGQTTHLLALSSLSSTNPLSEYVH